MNISTPTNMTKVSEEEFREYLKNFPHYRRTAYIGGIVYHPKGGTHDQIGIQMDSKIPPEYYV